MDVFSIYYYAGIPVITCNMLFYSMSAISSSITSSQNVFKFISEHKDSDSTIFKNEVELLDLENRLKITEGLIYEVLKKHCINNDEFDKMKNNIRTPEIAYTNDAEFALIEIKNDSNAILNRMSIPIRQSLLSTSDIVQSISSIMNTTKEKIEKHDSSYLTKMITLSLKTEIASLKKQAVILEKRLDLLLKLLVALQM